MYEFETVHVTNLRKYFIDQAFLLHRLLNYFNNWRLYFRATYLRTHIHVLPYFPLKIHVLSPKSREHKFKLILSWDMQAKIWNHFQRIQYPREFFFNLIHKVELPYPELKWAGNHRHLRKKYISISALWILRYFEKKSYTHPIPNEKKVLIKRYRAKIKTAKWDEIV